MPGRTITINRDATRRGALPVPLGTRAAKWSAQAKGRGSRAGRPPVDKDKDGFVYDGTKNQAAAPNRPTARPTSRPRAKAAPITPKSKGTRAERLARIQGKADKLYAEAKAKGGKAHASAYDRSVAIDRAVFREQRGAKAGAKGRGSNDRHVKALEAVRARQAKAKPTAPTPAPPKPTPKPVAAKTSKGTPERNRSAALLHKLRNQKAKASKPDTGHADREPGFIGDVKRDEIHFDPQRFQYKQDLTSHETGSVGSLAGVKKWDPELAGVIQVWKDPANGKTYVVNGHNRLDLARKIGVDKVAVRYIAAKDAVEARGKGALTNIAEGRGTAMDAAKFFKDTGIRKAELESRGIPMREKIADDGLALSNLEPRLFRRVIDGTFTQERGAIIGRAGLTEPQQNALVDLIDKKPKGHNLTNDVLSELTDTVKSSGSKSSGGFDLFGDTGEQSMALHKASLQASIKGRLGREKRLFGLVSKSKAATDLERGGNKIDAGKSGAIAKDATEALGTFDALKNMSGPISSKLNRAAERIDKGESRKKVEDEVYAEILKEVASGEAIRF